MTTDEHLDWSKLCWAKKSSGAACRRPATWRSPTDRAGLVADWRACDEHHHPSDVPIERNQADPDCPMDEGHYLEQPARTPDPGCSFCGKSTDDCGALIQATKPGRDVAICGECAVSAAHEVMTLAQRLLETARDRTREAVEWERIRAMQALKLAFDDSESLQALEELLSVGLQDQRLDEEVIRALFHRVCKAKGWAPTEES